MPSRGRQNAGANPIIALDVLDQKLAAARAFGATHGVNARDTEARERVLELTAGRGVDYTIVAVGSTAAGEQALALTRRGGTIVIAGMPHVESTLPLPVYRFVGSGRHILGSSMGSTRLSVDVPRLVGLYQAGRLQAR